MASKRPKSQQERLNEQLLQKLRELGGELTAEEDLVFEGRKFVIPETMNLKDALKFVQNKINEDEEEANWRRTFPFRPKDGAVATERALRNAFGSMGHHTTFSFWGPVPPQFIDVEIGHNEVVQAPWGQVSVPAFPDVRLNLYAVDDPELGQVFGIMAEGKKKRRFEVQGLFKLIEDELRQNSIYRGQPIDAGYGFLDITRVDPNKVVYAEEVLTQLEANIFARLRYPDALRHLDVPLKGAVLLHGKYGVGKTLAAYLTAQEAVKVETPWTFILVRPGRDDLEEAMATAAMYEPSVVFFEDVDRIASSEEEGDRITNLLDLFDGARAKGREVFAVLTTNFAETIHKGMVRPGRLDAVIEITAPDHAGIIKMIRTILPEEAVDPEITDDQWDEVAQAMAGFLPAFIREAADRAVRYLLVRTEGKLNGIKLTHTDLIQAAEGLIPQLELMEGAKDTPTKDRLGDALRETLRPQLEETGEQELRENLDPRVLVESNGRG